MEELAVTDRLCGGLRMDAATRERLRQFGALRWTEEEIADWFGVSDRAAFHAALADRNSEVSRELRRGALFSRAEMEGNILRRAAAGEADYADRYRELVRDRSFSMSKLDIFGGCEDGEAWRRLEDYISSGSSRQLSDKEQAYIDMLMLTYSIEGQYGKRRTVKFLTGAPFNLTHARAVAMIDEATELFFRDRKVSKAALRAKMADQYDALYHAVMESARTVKDYEVAASILERKAKVQQLDREDPVALDAAAYRRQYRVLSLTPESVGLPSADRRALAEQIDALDVPEADRARLRQEAQVDDLDIVKYLNDESQETD